MCPGIGDDPVRMDNAVDAQPVLGFVVVDGMAADQAGPGLDHFIVAAAQDLPEDAHIEMFGREHHDIQGGERFAAHGIDIGDRIGRGDLAEPVGIIDRRGDKINGVDHRHLIGELVDRGIVGGLYADQQVLIALEGQSFECVRQIRRTDFRRSATGSGEPCQCLFLEPAHSLFS